MRIIRLRRYVQKAVRQWRKGNYDAYNLLGVKLPQQVHEFTDGTNDHWLIQVHGLMMAITQVQGGEITLQDLHCMAFAFLRHSQSTLKGFLRSDREAFISAQTEELDDAIQCRDSAREWKQVHRLLNLAGRRHPRFQGGRKLPIRRRNDGSIIRTSEELADARIQHFAQMEDAAILTVSEAVQQYNDSTHSRALYIHTTLAAVPTRNELMRSFATAKKRKAAGPDQVMDDLLRAAPAHTLQLFCTRWSRKRPYSARSLSPSSTHCMWKFPSQAAPPRWMRIVRLR